MYIKTSESLNFWLSVLISEIPPYLMFILVSKSTHPVSLVLSSQNARLCICRNCALIRPTNGDFIYFIYLLRIVGRGRGRIRST